MSDGNLRAIFQQHMPDAHWQPVETWSTGQGVPDAEYCFPGGRTGWVENKLTQAWAVDISAVQVAWLERRSRKGGRVFVAVRRRTQGGPRSGPAQDSLYLFRGETARALRDLGLGSASPLGLWHGGPARWRWEEVRGLLTA